VFFFSFCLFFQTSSVVFLILNQSSIGQSNGFSYFRSIFFFLLYLFALYFFFPLCLHFPSCLCFSFHFPFILFIFSILHFLHNIPWITINFFSFSFPFILFIFPFSSRYLLNNDKLLLIFTSVKAFLPIKKLAFPCFLYIFSIHSFPSIFFHSLYPSLFSSSSTGTDIQFGLLTAWMFSSILNITLRFDSRYYQVVFDSRYFISSFLILPFLSCDLWGPVCCLFPSYISLVFARMSMS